MPTRTFPGQYASLADIAAFVRQSAVQAGIEGFDLYAVETAVDEACSNIIEHGYKGEGVGEIVCSLTVTKEGLTIILTDFGQPFNPRKIKKPRTDAPLGERESHGLGLYFMHQLMDEVRFGSSPEGGNTVTMIKRIKKESQTE